MERKYRPISLGAPGEEISTKDLHAISQRFKNLNQFRLQNVQNFLQPRQRVFLQLLPLAFHQNNPLLPGFVSSQTPFGIPDYTPHKETIHAAKLFSKTFRYTRKARLNHGIESIFLMGSVGSIAFSKTSDMDIWLCHTPCLNKVEIEELQEKATLLENWAHSLGLEVHFFLINSEQFKAGEKSPLSSESSGSTQHYLLLEEFYRTAIYIAGKFPAWWIVPAEHESHYSEYLAHLLQSRFISKHEIIDFGGLENVPADEFISATLWHLLKSLSSPYKSLLKLFLMECYASEYPDTQWLCTQLKYSVFQGEIDIDKLDPYLMIYEKVEEYLQLVSSKKQLLLARQCFYLKIMGSKPGALDHQTRSLRLNQLQRIATQWQWPDDLLDNLSKHLFWDINKVVQSHHIIRSQLKHSLQTIVRFSQHHTQGDYRNNIDLKLIARKLHAFMEFSPGKVEILTTRTQLIKKENELTLVESEEPGSEGRWFLSLPGNHSLDTQATPLKQCDSLLELCCWIVANRLYKPNLKINLSSRNCKLSQSDIYILLARLDRFILSKLQHDHDLEHYKHSNKLQYALLFINFNDEEITQRDDGNLVMSERSDPLSYGENRTCFVSSVHCVTLTSWGEITLQRYTGLDGLFNCIIDAFNTQHTSLQPEDIQLACFTPLRAKSIVSRIQQLIENIASYFQHNPNTRYILPAKEQYCVFQQNAGMLDYFHIDSDEQLLQELSHQHADKKTIIFDNHALPDSPVPFIYSHITADNIDLFYVEEEHGIQVYIIDEQSALFSHFHDNSNAQQVLMNYEIFFSSLQNQAKLSLENQVNYFELVKNSANLLAVYPAKSFAKETNNQLNVKIIGKHTHNTKHISIYCNESEFSSDNFEDVFSEVREFILNYRSGHDDYPIYINEINVPPAFLGIDGQQKPHSVRYLQYKQKIESRLSI